MKKILITFLSVLSLLIVFTSCTRGLILCFIDFYDLEETYEFDFSKEELKNRIVASYSYNESVFLKIIGKNLIENENVNKEYRKSVEIWLDKRNWDKFKSEIRNNTSDTLNLLIGKHNIRKEINFLAIIQGNNNKSSLTIKQIKYTRKRVCNKDHEYYKIKVVGKIEDILIDKLK